MRGVALGVLLSLGGCSSSHVLPPVDEDLALYGEVWDALCARALACERDPGLTAYACDPGERAYLLARISSRAVHVDREAAAECLDGLGALERCVEHAELFSSTRHPARLAGLDSLVVACETVLVEDGVACDGAVCPIGDRCELDSSCRGRCAGLPPAVFAELGEPCSDTTRCGRHLRCRRSGESGVCEPDCYHGGITACRIHGGEQCTGTSVRCAGAPIAGEPCEELPDGEPTCEIGAICDSTTGLCRPRSVLGEPCEPGPGDTGCAPHFECDFATGTCIAAAGEGCDGRLDCPPGELCHADGTCAADPQGARCYAQYLWPTGAVIGWIDSCPDGYACSGPSAGAICRRVVGEGEACDEGTACVEGTACREGTCSRSRSPFEGCAGPGDCPDGSSCDAGRCVAPLMACSSGECTWGGCVEGTCRYLPPGSSCETGRECLACLDGVCRVPGTGALGERCADGLYARDHCARSAGLTCRSTSEGRRCCPGP